MEDCGSSDIQLSSKDAAVEKPIRGLETALSAWHDMALERGDSE